MRHIRFKEAVCSQHRAPYKERVANLRPLRLRPASRGREEAYTDCSLRRAVIHLRQHRVAAVDNACWGYV